MIAYRILPLQAKNDLLRLSHLGCLPHAEPWRGPPLSRLGAYPDTSTKLEHPRRKWKKQAFNSRTFCCLSLLSLTTADCLALHCLH